MLKYLLGCSTEEFALNKASICLEISLSKLPHARSFGVKLPKKMLKGIRFEQKKSDI